jgi:ATP-dependent DNA helicase RecG
MAFDLQVANLARDGQIVQQARDMASWILDEDPLLELPENQVLVERMRQTRGDRIDWSNIS